MDVKKFIILGMVLGSTLGSLIPYLWGADSLSLSSILFSAIGGFLGIWLAWRWAQ